MSIDTQPAAAYSDDALANLFSACFANYFVPLHIDASTIRRMAVRDSVDLAESRVLVSDGRPAGFMLLAFRGDGARIAAMGILPEVLRLCLARQLVTLALTAARARGCAALNLEVITTNDPAVRLYEAMGFQRVNALLGFTFADSRAADAANAPARAESCPLSPVDAGTVAEWVARHGAPTLPWQLAAETMRVPLPGSAAFEWADHAACLISDPGQDQVVLFSLVVHRDRRRSGVGRAVLAELRRRYPGRNWRIPQLPAGARIRSRTHSRGNPFPRTRLSGDAKYGKGLPRPYVRDENFAEAKAHTSRFSTIDLWLYTSVQRQKTTSL